MTPRIFELLEYTKPGKNGEIQLTDAIKKLVEFEPIYAYRFSGKRYDLGDKMGFLKANVDFALKHKDLSEGFLLYLKQVVSNEALKTSAKEA